MILKFISKRRLKRGATCIYFDYLYDSTIKGGRNVDDVTFVKVYQIYINVGQQIYQI